MNTALLQKSLFQSIRDKMPPHLVAADEIARILGTSTDSVYRRMRGEKTISLDELSLLCQQYQVSLDELMNIQTGSFLFRGHNLGSADFNFHEYMDNMLLQLNYMIGFKQRDFYYLLKDIPVFQHFHFREIAAFKYYFWMKTIFHTNDYTGRKFSFADYPDEFFEKGQKLLSLYSRLNVMEIMNIETLNSTVRQIEFYHDEEMFESKKDILEIYSALEKLMDRLEQQADAGHIFDKDHPGKKPEGSYQLYFNEIMLGDNTVLADLDGSKIVYLVHSGINYMFSRDRGFCEYTYDTFQNLMQKSTLISSVGEDERSRFFKFLRERIANRKESLKVQQ